MAAFHGKKWCATCTYYGMGNFIWYFAIKQVYEMTCVFLWLHVLQKWNRSSHLCEFMFSKNYSVIILAYHVLHSQSRHLMLSCSHLAIKSRYLMLPCNHNPGTLCYLAVTIQEPHVTLQSPCSHNPGISCYLTVTLQSPSRHVTMQSNQAHTAVTIHHVTMQP